jgi:dipeptidyl aminopeptidase/acylaminoacyl peptidase
VGKQEGRDFEYVELSDEGHGSADQEQRLRAFRLLADFLQRVL